MNDTEIEVEEPQAPDAEGFCPYCGQAVRQIQLGAQLEDEPPF
jgi:hypothetical protein